jgi:hypothetical protein
MELVASGGTLVKLENTTQMQIAIQRPRNEDKILVAAKAELDRYPSMADEAIYSKPAGKDKDTGNMKYVEGLSIRAAEALANRWSNSAYGCDIVGEDKEAIYIAAVFMDYENNTRHDISRRISKTYRSVRRSSFPPPDRLDMKVAAEMAAPGKSSGASRPASRRMSSTPARFWTCSRSTTTARLVARFRRSALRGTRSGRVGKKMRLDGRT